MDVRNKNRFWFKRPCRRCGNMFRPAGKLHKICDECRQKDYDKLSKLLKKERRNQK